MPSTGLKNVFLFFLFGLSLGRGEAQSYSLGMTGEVRALLPGSDGGLILGGLFRGERLVGKRLIKSRGEADIFLSIQKTPLNGIVGDSFLTVGGARNEYWCDAETDERGNIYLCGGFEGTLYLNADSLLHSPNPALFLMALTPQGKLRYVRRIGGTGRVTLNDLHRQGNRLFMTGDYTDSLWLDGRSFAHPGYAHTVWVACWEAERGRLLWQVQSGHAGLRQAEGKALCTDDVGNLYLAGDYAGALELLPGDTLYANPIHTDIFWAKLSPQGQWLQAKRFGGVFHDSARRLLFDPERRCLFLGGELTGILDLDSLRLMTAYKYPDIFVAKLDTEGRILAAVQTQAAERERESSLSCMKLLPGGSLICAGTFRGDLDAAYPALRSAGGSDVFMAIWRPDAPRFDMPHTLGASGNELLHDLLPLPQGRIRIAGAYQTPFAGLPPPAGFFDGFCLERSAND